MKKTLLFTLLLSASAIGFSQVQPIVHNPTFTTLTKASGSACTCTGWINKDIADQAESSTLDSNDAIKLDDLESDGLYQEIAVIANSVYNLNLSYQYKNASGTTQHIEVLVLKGSGYDNNLPYTPAYAATPFDSAQSGYGYTLVGAETPANKLAGTLITNPGDTNTNAMTQISFNTGSETSIAIFIRAVGPYNFAIHGDPTKTYGWMNGSEEIRVDNLTLVNTTALSTKDFLASKLNIYPNPANDYITIKSNSVKLSSVELYNVLGARVLSAKTLNNDRLNISGVSKGIYMLKVNAEGASSTKKIVIE